MKSKFVNNKLESYITEVSVRNNENNVNQVYSITNSDGFIKSTDFFDKEVYSKNLGNYKIVKPNQFAYNPSRINVGSIDYLRTSFEVIVSPLYIVFECNKALSNEYLLKYLKSVTGNKQIRTKTRGAVRDSLPFKNLIEIEIPITSFEEQTKINVVLTQVENIIKKRKVGLTLLNKILQCKFYELFGDPIKNNKGWTKWELASFGKIITGNTPPRINPDNYSSNYLEWIKTDNISSDNTYLNPAHEFISEAGMKNARVVNNNALLVTCISGSNDLIGKAALTNKKVAFNQQINAIEPNETTAPFFLYWLIKCSASYIQTFASKGMTKVISKGVFEKIELIKPNIKDQLVFENLAKEIEVIKEKFTISKKNILDLYRLLSLYAFNGNLNLDKLEVAFEEVVIENSVITPEKREKPILNTSSSLKNVIDKNFNNSEFIFEDLAKKYQANLNNEEYDYNTLKLQIFNSLIGNNDINLEQIFNQEEKKIFLRIAKK